MIIMLTGQPCSGKTTVARYMQLKNKVIIDGDLLRKVFPVGYDAAGREKNVQRAYDMAKYLDSIGFNPIISLVNPFREKRENLKLEVKECVEIYLHYNTDEEERGREEYHWDGYEIPEDPDVDINTSEMSLEETLEYIDNMLEMWSGYGTEMYTNNSFAIQVDRLGL